MGLRERIEKAPKITVYWALQPKIGEKVGLNARNPKDVGALFATGVFLRISPSGSCEVLSAGDPPILVRRRDGGLAQIGATGLPLALISGNPAEVVLFDLESGDLVVIATDGFFEATDAQGAELGLDRIVEDVSRARQVAAHIYKVLESHHDLARLNDDLSLLVLCR